MPLLSNDFVNKQGTFDQQVNDLESPGLNTVTSLIIIYYLKNDETCQKNRLNTAHTKSVCPIGSKISPFGNFTKQDAPATFEHSV